MIRVAFLCNDEQGDPLGFAEAILLEDSRGYSATLWGPALRFAHEQERIKFGRRFFEIKPASARYRTGTQRWDSVEMPREASLRLLRYALERGFVPAACTERGPFAETIRRAERKGAQHA